MQQRERLLLSGAAVTQPFMDCLFEMTNNSHPVIACDLTPSTTNESYTNGQRALAAFAKRGATVIPLQTAFGSDLPRDETLDVLERADSLYVGGGSPRRLKRIWDRRHLTQPITAVISEGNVVAAGASAGAMIWFEHGFSDCRQYEVSQGSRWNYVGVAGVGLLKGWVSPHYSDIDAFGRDRSYEYKRTLRREKGWRMALGIERYAVLRCIEGTLSAFDVRLDPPESLHSVHIFPGGDVKAVYPLEPGETIELNELY